MQRTLYLMLGLPGAGKSTASQALAEIVGGQRFSSDELRSELFPNSEFTQAEHDKLYTELDGRLETAMQAGQNPLIYDANLNRRMHRDEKYTLAERYGYKTVLLWVQAEKSLAKQRRVEETSAHHLVPSHEDPASMFDRIAGVFEAPGPDESFTELDGTKITPEYMAAALDL